jgi:hypothetical protein
MKKILVLINYVKEFDTIFLFVIFYQVLEVVIVLLSIIIFILFYWRNFRKISFNKSILSLPLKNKFVLVWFTLFFAIPNKILVNNRIPSSITAIIVFLIILVSNFFPVFILIYVNFWITVLESYFFAVFYEEKISFKIFVNRTLFQSNTVLAKEYFTYFWGNTYSKGVRKVRAGAGGSVIGALYKIAREHEKSIVRERSKEETTRHIANSQEKPKTPHDAFELQKELEEHVLKRDTTILNGERFVKNNFDKVLHWFQD